MRHASIRVPLLRINHYVVYAYYFGSQYCTRTVYGSVAEIIRRIIECVFLQQFDN